MKKLKFGALEIGATEVLTRAQLRNIMGKGSIGAYCSGPNDPVCGNDICVNHKCAPAGSGGYPISDCRITPCPLPSEKCDMSLGNCYY